MKRITKYTKKVLGILPFCLFTFPLFISCADDDMVEMNVQEPETLSSYDYLKDYDVLKSYNSHIGVIMSNSDLTSTGMPYRIAVSNFSEVAPENTFSHSKIVKANGSLDTASISSIRRTASQNGLSLLGTPMIWHNQQNSTYLNSLLDPNVIRPEGDDGGYCMKLTNNAIASNAEDEQVTYTFARTPQVEPGITYKIRLWVRGTAEGSVRLQAYSTSSNSRFSPDIAVTRQWTKVESMTTIAGGMRGMTSVLFSVGKYVGTLYVDSIELVEWNTQRNRQVGRNLNTVNTNMDDPETTASSIAVQTDNNSSLEDVGCSALGEGHDYLATYVEKTDEEKANILTSEMQRYIGGIIDASNSVTPDWVVVKNPLAEQDSTSTGFFWQNYLGKETYAVTAFQEAARHATGKLYIEESGLDTDLSKCAQFVSYVSAIENQGARVDGVAVTVDANTETTSIDNVSQMFRQLAATGKLVRVTDLKVSVGDATTDNVTEEQLKQQASFIGNIIKAYNDNVPEAQRGGITFHQILDGATPDGLWSTDYSRKHAYGSVVEAIK